MGVEDRDWYRNRKDHLHPDDPRAPVRRTRHRPAAATRTPRSRWRAWLFVLLLFGLVWALAKRGVFGDGALQQLMSNPGQALPILRVACNDPFPAAGAIAGEATVQAPAARSSQTSFVNRTPIDRVIDLLVGSRLIASVAVPASGTAVVTLPEGALDWQLRHGAAWCARKREFVREQKTIITNPLQIVSTSNLTVEIAPDPNRTTGFSLLAHDTPTVVSTTPAATASTSHAASGSILIPRARDGHYYIDGRIDNEDVRFLIDTGASRIAIPMTLARKLGYYEGREVTLQTAAGRTTGSEFKVRRIAFGPFVAEDVTVVALFELETPLLGMSLLQSIEMRQTAAGLQLQRAR